MLRPATPRQSAAHLPRALRARSRCARHWPPPPHQSPSRAKHGLPAPCPRNRPTPPRSRTRQGPSASPASHPSSPARSDRWCSAGAPHLSRLIIVDIASEANAASRIFLSSATRSQTPSARSRAAASAAAPNPAMPMTFSVPGAAPHLLPAATQLRAQIEPAPQHQRPHALRPAQLMRRDHAHLDTQPVEGQRQLAKSLRQIATPPAPRAESCTTPVSELASCSVAAAGSGTRHRARPIHRQNLIAPGQNRVMFDPGADQPPPGTAPAPPPRSRSR